MSKRPSCLIVSQLKNIERKKVEKGFICETTGVSGVYVEKKICGIMMSRGMIACLVLAKVVLGLVYVYID